MNNDRLKFRVWDNQEKVHIYNIGIWGDSFLAYDIDLPENYIETLAIKECCGIGSGDGLEITLSDRFVIEQCTGLSASKSYRGEKPEDLLIWEGDKYNLIDKDGKIISPDNVCELKDFFGGVYWLENHGGKVIIEIIGNIHEEK